MMDAAAYKADNHKTTRFQSTTTGLVAEMQGLDSFRNRLLGLRNEYNPSVLAFLDCGTDKDKLGA